MCYLEQHLNMKKYLIFTFCFVFVTLTIFAHSSNDRRDASSVLLRRPDSTFLRGVLSNGMTYYICKVGNGHRANFYLLQHTGALAEKEEEQGMAHLVEHMMFQGTEHFPKNGVYKFTKQLGLNFGPDLNAQTTFDHVKYNLETVPLILGGQRIDSCLTVLHDWSCAATLEEDALRHERRVVQEEERMRTMNGDFIETIQSDFMDGTPYAHHDILGRDAVLKNCTPKMMRDFYHHWYQPQLQAVVIVGDFDVKDMECRVKNIMGRIPRGTTPLPVVPKLQRGQGMKVQVLKAKKSSTVTFNITYLLPTDDPVQMDRLLRRRELDVYIMEKLNKRFEKMADKENSFFIAPKLMFQNNYLGTLAAGCMTVTAVCKPSEWKKSLQLVVKELEYSRLYGLGYKMNADALPERELKEKLDRDIGWADRAKYIMNREQVSGDLNRNFLYGAPIYKLTGGDVRDYWGWIINGGEIDRRLRNIMDDASSNVLVVMPEDSTLKVPSVEDVTNSIREAKALPFKSHSKTEKKSDGDRLKKLTVTPGKVVSRKLLSDGWTQLLLDNGVKVSMISAKDYAISISGIRMGGKTLVNDDELLMANCFEKALGNDYLKQYFPENKLEHMTVRRNNYWDELTVENPKQSFEVILQQIYLRLTHSAKDPKGWNQIMRTSGILNGDESAFIDSLERVKRLVLVPQALLNKKNLSHLHVDSIVVLNHRLQQNFCGTEFFIRGDFDLNKAIPLVAKYLGALPSKNRPVGIVKRERNLFKTYNDSVVHATYFPEPTALVMYDLVEHQNYEFTAYNHYHHEALLHILRTMMLERIRLDQGDVYNINVIGPDEWPPVQYISFNFTCAPGKWRKIVTDIDQILEEAASGKIFTQKMVNDYLVAERHNFSDISKLSVARKVSVLLHGGVDLAVERDEILKQISPESLSCFLRRLLDNGQKFKTVFYQE